MLLRLLLLLLACAAGPGRAPAGEAPLEKFAQVEVAPTWTSIYIGTVKLTLPAFARANGAYESSYVAKVFPYFFSNEKGRLSIDVPDTALRQLERGEAITFTGRAVNDAREERRIEGKATPVDATGGKLKVRVFVSPRIELIFNTTYRFPALAPPQAAGP